MHRIVPSFTAIMPADPITSFAPSSVTRVIDGVGVFVAYGVTTTVSTTPSRVAIVSRTRHSLEDVSAAA